MPSEDDREAALRRIVEFTEGMGNAIQGQAEGQTDDGRPLEGYQIQHGSHHLVVATVAGWEYFTVIYQHHLPQDIAVQRVAEEEVRSPAPSGEIEVTLDQQAIEDATDELRSHVEGVNLRDVRTRFTRTVAQIGGHQGIELQTDGDLIVGVQIKSKLFPYRDGFDIAEYERTVQQTVTAGWVAKEFLIDAYDIADLTASDLGTDPSDDDPKMFQ